MNVEAKRNELIQWILNLKEEDLTKLETIKNRSLQDDIAAFTVDAKPLSLEEYHSELEEAEKDIERGNFLTSSQLDQEIASWVK